MEFSVKIPYRKVTLKISLEAPETNHALMQLERWAKRQSLAEIIDSEVRDHQNNFFLLNWFI